MRRARIQIKPNVAKAAKQQAPPPEVAPEAPPPDVVPEVASEEVVMTENQNSSPSPSPSDDAPSESMKSLHVDVSRNHHVHFTEDVVDNEHGRKDGEMQNHINSTMVSPTSFATPRLMTPRSRNVSMCEDESILQPKQAREKKRFSGKEALDTKTWKMSDLARWNPRNEQTSFKRERRSSTSSTIITKSEAGDFDSPTPRINAPQVKIGADGRLVIDETSLVVQSAQINHESVWETVEEGRMGSKITSMSFRNRMFRKPNMWSARETDLFYEVLQCTGTDFGLMHHYLPQRSRPELKAKYNREEKHNWARLLKAISHPTRLDGDLESRIAKVMEEIEFEVQEKKVIKEYEKEEERKIREQIRLQKATERAEEKIKKLQAKELIRQAKELEKDARNAQKLSDMLTEKAQREAKQQEKVEKEKERLDVKRLAEEARKCAMEAKRVIMEKRKAEAQERKDARVQAESHNLEREAERIIRRLIQESQREERKKAQMNKKASSAKKTEGSEAKDAEAVTTSTPPVDPSAEDLVDEEISESSESAESSDEDAIPADTARREKQRMKEARIERKPRQTVVDHKPIYVNTMDAKYAQQPVNKAIEMAIMAKGNLFDSADEDFEVPEQMDTTPAPDDSQPGPAPPPADPESEKPVEEEPVPQAVTDVIEEMGRCRSKTPVAAEEEEKEKEDEEDEEPKKKKAKIDKVDTKKVQEVEKPKNTEAKTDNTEASEAQQGTSSDEPKKKKAKVEKATTKKVEEVEKLKIKKAKTDTEKVDEPEAQKEANVAESEAAPPAVVDNYDANLYEEFVDVEALSPEPYFRLALRNPPASTSTDITDPAEPLPVDASSSTPGPSTSIAPESTPGPSESPAPPKPTLAPRRTVKKPVFYSKKK